jgi:hypothetical protein
LAAKSWGTWRDPALVTSWITQTQAERIRAQAQLDQNNNQPAGTRRMSRDEIANLVHALGDIVLALAEADPADKAEVYRQLGLRLTVNPPESWRTPLCGFGPPGLGHESLVVDR